VLGKCGLAGGNSGTCQTDLEVTNLLVKARNKLAAGVRNKCGNRTPAPSVPFCCRTGQDSQCTVVAGRVDCESLGGSIQEGQVCNAGNCGDPAVGGEFFTWWSSCPESDTCPGMALVNLDDLIACVGASADATVGELFCQQLPNGWSCPGSDEVPTTTTTTTTTSTTTTTTTSCGAIVSGYCWYLASGQSCSEACAQAGRQYDSATQFYAGSDGLDGNCLAVLSALNVPSSLPFSSETCGEGFGCAVIQVTLQDYVRVRCVSPPTDADATNAFITRACACQ
jgi:hypothetical protein